MTAIEGGQTGRHSRSPGDGRSDKDSVWLKAKKSSTKGIDIFVDCGIAPETEVGRVVGDAVILTFSNHASAGRGKERKNGKASGRVSEWRVHGFDAKWA